MPTDGRTLFVNKAVPLKGSNSNSRGWEQALQGVIFSANPASWAPPYHAYTDESLVPTVQDTQTVWAVQRTASSCAGLTDCSTRSARARPAGLQPVPHCPGATRGGCFSNGVVELCRFHEVGARALQ